MYNANVSYEDNYLKGPDARFVQGGKFPIVTFNSEPRYSFLGVPLHIPFGIPAGPLLNAAFVRVALNAGFCLPIYKTVRSRPWKSHVWPNVLSIEAEQNSLFVGKEPSLVRAKPFEPTDYQKTKSLSISNSFGVPSQDPQTWSEDFCKLAGPKLGENVMLSFQGTRPDWAGQGIEGFAAFVEDACRTAVLSAQTLARADMQILEINLSCPNEKGEPIYRNISDCVTLLRAVKMALGAFPRTKIIATIGVLSSEQTFEFMRRNLDFLDGISAINTVSARIHKPEGGFALGSGSEVGGICGSLIFEQGLAQVSELQQVRKRLGVGSESLAIIGVGGVLGVPEFQRFIEAGADVVQAATGAMWNLALAQDVARFLQVPIQIKEG